MAEQVRLMLSPLRREAEGTVVGSDVLARRRYKHGFDDKAHFLQEAADGLLYLLCARLRPQSDRGETHKLSLFCQTRDHTQIEKGNSVGVGIEPCRPRPFSLNFALLPSITCGGD